MSVIRLRDIRPDDAPALAELNDAATPAVNSLGVEGMAALLAICDVTLVATGANGATGATGNILAFVLSMGPGQPYASENYRWFEARGGAHQYIDRIVVAPQAAGRGLGRALYTSIFDRATAAGRLEITTEINLEPPNPESAAFHRRMGFRQVGEQLTRGGTVRVALMTRPASAMPGDA